MLFDIFSSFIPECYLDTNLVESLLKVSDSVNHKKGNSNVVKQMGNDRFKDSFIVALIDDDKIKVKELEKFEKIERLSKSTLKLFKNPGSSHYVIQISPAIEKWLLNECLKSGINLDEYNLPIELQGLKTMKGLSQRKDERFKRLFKAMLKQDRCDEIIELKRWLEFFRDNNFNSNLDLL